MSLTIVDAVTDPGRPDRANEDGFGSTGDFVWVIDGATGLGDTQLLDAPSDAAWLTATIDAAFRKHAAEADGPHTLLRLAAQEAEARFLADRKRPPSERYEIPTASVLVARFGVGHVDIADVGDCAIHIRSRDGMARFGGTEAGRALERDNAQRLMSGGSGRSPDVIAFLRRVRNKANTPGGYAIFAPDAASAEAVRLAHHGFDGPCEGLLLTDGFEAAIDDYALFGSAELLDAARHGLRHPLQSLRKVERDDPDCIRFPRFKPSDDATALYLRYDSIQTD